MEYLTFTSVFVAVLSILCPSLAQITGDPVIRTTTLGQVLGSAEPPIDRAVPVEKYFGIPYAKPPVGELRFEDPEAAQAWSPEVLPALHLHPACPQIDEDLSYIAEHRPGFNHTDEDCLYLNIFVPVLNNATRDPVPGAGSITGVPTGSTIGQVDASKLAVLVFIHGGSSVVGTANMFDGDILAAVGEIIVVTINYRLAALGFLGTGQSDFPGNYGILDQIAALRWIQENIGAFNGDPAKVTVMGHSAASMNAGVLLVSPLAKGLFRTIICQSGAPSAVITTRYPTHNSTKELLGLGALLNCTETTTLGIKQCLKTIDVVTLSTSYPVYDWYQFPAIVEDKVLPKPLVEMMKTAELNADTFLIGTTRDEAGKWAYDLKGFANISNMLILLHLLPGGIELRDLTRFEYTDVMKPENSTTDVRIASMAYGDSLFDAPTVQTLDILSQRNISTHQYRWEWRSKTSPLPEVSGVPHGSDLFFLFGSPLRGHELYNYTAEDRNMSIIMMRQWSHFVKKGSFEINQFEWPNPPTLTDLSFKNDTRTYVRFYSENDQPAIGVENNFKPRQAAFWGTVMPNLRDNVEKTLDKWRNDELTPPTTPVKPTDDTNDDFGVDVEELGREKELFLVLFIIFLVLSCLLLLMLMFVCIMFCTSRNSSKFSAK